MLVRELAEMLGATYEGEGEREIAGVAALESAGTDQISFVGNRRGRRDAHASSAGCLIVPLDFDSASGRTLIRAKDARAAFARVVERLVPSTSVAPGIHPTVVVGLDCVIDATATIGPYTVLGDRVSVGAGSRLCAHVTVYADVAIGARALIHSGAVLGADGFGFVFEGGALHEVSADWPGGDRRRRGDRRQLHGRPCGAGGDQHRGRHQARQHGAHRA